MTTSPSFLTKALVSIRSSRAMLRKNTAKFRLPEQHAEFVKAASALGKIMNKSQTTAPEVFPININGKNIPRVMTPENVRAVIIIPDSVEDKLKALSAYTTVSVFGIASAAVIYVALRNQCKNAEELLLAHAHCLDADYLFGLQEIGEGRLHPNQLLNPNKLVKELVKNGASFATQDEVFKSNEIAVPVINIRDRRKIIVVEMVPPYQVTEKQAKCLCCPDGTYLKDHNAIIAAGQRLIKEEEAREDVKFRIEDKRIHINNKIVIGRNRFRSLILEYYQRLGNADDLKEIVAKVTESPRSGGRGAD